ncbi:Beta-barrel assembly-enhancing protease [Paraglaciecola mesophila]|uniref:Beta-barrel assembly-enhancing protease n=1 Tax=Paraglaciecola mesophila TaxID=197222 RepID=A0A857JSR0_9ALTE|nr:tetratricopeptide repeat-containing sulfotransferase family protein [Paraglaciecola mesophila]QHJ13654.1 Beta-barrel assembly-enhancing protease [Paraglaciecola mesophila]
MSKFSHNSEVIADMTNIPDFILDKINQAYQLHTLGQHTDAIELLNITLTTTTFKEPVLRALVQLYIEANDIESAIADLEQLVSIASSPAVYVRNLYALCYSGGEKARALNYLRSYVSDAPTDPEGLYNLADGCKRERLFDDALHHYGAAIDCGFSDKSLAKLNIADIHQQVSKEEQAITVLNEIVKDEPTYLPALFNLASLCDELADKDRAFELYQKILTIQPDHALAMSRLASMKMSTNECERLILTINSALSASEYTPDEQESLYFALGKLYDDCQKYKQAAHFYTLGNQLQAKNSLPYNHLTQEQLTQDVCRNFNSQWVYAENLAFEDPLTPIFICGMFRSGSTLVEQILSAHPDVESAGEIDFFKKAVEKIDPNFHNTKNLSEEALLSISQEYKNNVNRHLSSPRFFTDKNPVNFALVGIIKRVFPHAKFIFTQRNRLDNCLSVYFQQLDRSFNYATSLTDIKHCYDEQIKVLNHWQDILSDDDYLVLNYESLVSNFDTELASLLDFLKLQWSDTCLAFYKQKKRVKTASIWQVRQPINTNSLSRWQNYTPYLKYLND